MSPALLTVATAVPATAIRDSRRQQAPAAQAAAGAAPGSGSAGGPGVEATARDDTRRAVDQANQAVRQRGSELSFEFNDEAERVVVKLVDKRTGEVIRQIPSEEMLQIARALEHDAQAGALLRADA